MDFKKRLIQQLPAIYPLKGATQGHKERPFCLQNRTQHALLSSLLTGGLSRENQMRADSDMRRNMTESSHPLICPCSLMQNLPDFIIVSRNSAGCSRSKAGSTLAAGPGAAPGKHLAPLRFDTNNHSQTFPPQTHVKMDWSDYKPL